MVAQSRLEDLRRRVQKDPASIAFAQLAEEYRRGGHHAEAIDTCRAGLTVHPGYLSARVTLGRSLIELGRLDEALHELETVHKSAPENLAAIRGLAEIYHKRGAFEEALTQYKAALNLARNDPDLQETVNDLIRKLSPESRPQVTSGLSLDQMQAELSQRTALSPAAPSPAVPPPAVPPLPAPMPPEHPPRASAMRPAVLPPAVPHQVHGLDRPAGIVSGELTRAGRTAAALEEWLAAIHVARNQQRT